MMQTWTWWCFWSRFHCPFCTWVNQTGAIILRPSQFGALILSASPVLMFTRRPLLLSLRRVICEVMRNSGGNRQPVFRTASPLLKHLEGCLEGSQISCVNISNYNFASLLAAVDKPQCITQHHQWNLLCKTCKHAFVTMSQYRSLRVNQLGNQTINYATN